MSVQVRPVAPIYKSMKKKILKTAFIVLASIAVLSLSYKIFVIEKRRAEIKEEIAFIEKMEKETKSAIVIPRDGAPSPPPPAVIQISPTDGLRIELDQTTSWNTILQLIFTLLSTYLGIRLINKNVRD